MSFTTTFVANTREYIQRTMQGPTVEKIGDLRDSHYVIISSSLSKIVESIDLCPYDKDKVTIGIYCRGKWVSKVVQLPGLHKASYLQGAVTELEKEFLSKYEVVSLPYWNHLPNFIERLGK